MNSLGYDLESIGLRVVLSDGELRPDISFKSHKSNILLLGEVKGGGVDNVQAKKYKALKPDDISKQGLTTLPAPNLQLDVFYACTSENRESVMNNEAKHAWRFPILTFDGGTLKKERTNARFKDPDVESLFSEGVTLDHELTYSYYPFGEGDTIGWIAQSLLYTIGVLWTQNERIFSTERLVVASHPLLGFFGKDERRQLFAITRSVLMKISTSPNVHVSVKPLRGEKWQIDRFVIGKYMRKYISLLADSLDAPKQYVDLQRYLDEESRKAEDEEKSQEREDEDDGEEDKS